MAKHDAFALAKVITKNPLKVGRYDLPYVFDLFYRRVNI